MKWRANFERLLRVLWLEQPDVVPLYEHFVDLEVIEALTGERISAVDLTTRRGKLKYVQVLVEFYKRLGYDYVPLELPLKLPRDNVLVARDTAPLSRGLRVWQDENRGVIEVREDYDSYPWPDPEEAVDYELMELLCKELPSDMGVVGGVAGGVLEHVMWLMGSKPFFKALYRDRVLIERMFDTVGELIYEVDKRIVEFERVGVLRMGDDMGFRKGTLISPGHLRRYVFPWQKKCVELAHRHGKPFILHSCGNLEVIMEDLIEYVKIDAKHSFEDAIMPVAEAKKRYGDRIAILGGVDVDKMARLPLREFKYYVKRVLMDCAPGGGYALGSGNSVTNYVKIENYLAMIDMRKRYGMYPKP